MSISRSRVFISVICIVVLLETTIGLGQPQFEDINIDSFLVSDTIYLADLSPAKISDVHGGLGVRKTYWGENIVIGGTIYLNGLCIHPRNARDTWASVEYSLRDAFISFETVIGWASQKNANKSSGPCAEGAKYYRFILN